MQLSFYNSSISTCSSATSDLGSDSVHNAHRAAPLTTIQKHGELKVILLLKCFVGKQQLQIFF